MAVSPSHPRWIRGHRTIAGCNDVAPGSLAQSKARLTVSPSSSGGLLSKHPHTPSRMGGATSPQGAVDPSPAMLREAERMRASEGGDLRRRVRLVEDEGERAAEILGRESFDAVLCHVVLMYLEDSRPMIKALAAIARPGGLISVLAKNASALAKRPALEGRYGDALSALETDRYLGRLGAVTRAETVEVLRALLKEAGVGRWYGVRLFTDHLGDLPPDPNLPDVLKLEWEAGRRDPYRSVARLIHLIGQR